MAPGILQLLIISLVFFLSSNLEARQTASTISGIVTDTGNQPVQFATVVLLTPDSVIVKGETTNAEGNFLIRNVAPGSYMLEIRNVAYEPKLTGLFEISPAENRVLEPILLYLATTELNQVSISATRPLIEIYPDKTVFNVESSINAAGNDGLELLGKAPGITVDPDNNIIMQGRAGVRVYINGRPTRLSGDDLTAMLQSMQSDNIESIEIITNPSARYDAEGNAGIINIKLRRNIQLGFNGSLVSNYNHGRHSRTNHGLNTNYQRGRLNMYSNITGFHNYFQSDFIDTKIQNNLSIKENTFGLNRNQGLNFSSGIVYEHSDMHSVSFTGNIIVNDRNETAVSRTPIRNSDDLLIREILFADNLNIIDSRNVLLSGNYRLKPAHKTVIDVDASYSTYSRSSDLNQPNTWFGPDGSSVQREINNRVVTDSDIRLWAVQSDLEQTIGKTTFTAGVKYSNILTGNDFNFYDLSGGNTIRDITRSNRFSYREEINAGYAIMQFPVGKKLSLNTGIRIEQTISEGNLTSEQVTQNENVRRNYTDLFPNTGLAYNNGKGILLGLSVGKRINRPGYQDLNPFDNKVNEINSFKGNPFLKPEYSMNYQFNFSFQQKLTGSLSYSNTSNFFAWLMEPIDTEKTIIIPQNMDDFKISSINLSYPASLLKNWEARAFVVVNRESYRGQFNREEIDIRTTTYNFRLQNSLSLPAGFSMDANFGYYSPSIYRGYFTVESYSRIDVGIRKNFLDGNLQVRITGSDIFGNSGNYYYSGSYGGMDIAGVLVVDSLRGGISLTWRFGNQGLKTVRRRTSALEEETQRLSD
jgi:iron complex outermembrane recepter protein